MRPGVSTWPRASPRGSTARRRGGHSLCLRRCSPMALQPAGFGAVVSFLARHEVISVLGQCSRYRCRRGAGNGLLFGPPRVSQPVMVLGGTPVSADAPAMSTQQSLPGSSGSPKSLPAGTRWPALIARASAERCPASPTGSDVPGRIAPPILQFYNCNACCIVVLRCWVWLVRLAKAAAPAGMPRACCLS